MKPVKPVDISVEEKQKIVQMLQERIRGYKENLSMLYDDLDALKPLPKTKSGQAGFMGAGCFDPDADGYDLNAKTPVEQAIQLLNFNAGLDSNTWGILNYWNLRRIGDVLNAMRNKQIMDLPGMGSKRYRNIKDSIGRLGFPVDWL